MDGWGTTGLGQGGWEVGLGRGGGRESVWVRTPPGSPAGWSEGEGQRRDNIMQRYELITQLVLGDATKNGHIMGEKKTR